MHQNLFGGRAPSGPARFRGPTAQTAEDKDGENGRRLKGGGTKEGKEMGRRV